MISYDAGRTGSREVEWFIKIEKIMEQVSVTLEPKFGKTESGKNVV